MVEYFTFSIADRSFLVGSKPQNPSQPAIFVAYNFDSPESAKFRVNLEAAIRRTTSLAELDILDGHVPVGEYWPSEVRARIEKVKLVVADLTLLSPDVLFECGFAWGLGRSILPVTRSVQGHEHLPKWLTDLQIGHFSSEEGLQDIVNSISHHIEGRQRKPRSRSAVATPGKVVVLAQTKGSGDIHDQCVAASAQWGLEILAKGRDVDNLQSIESDLAEEVAHASLLIGELTGRQSDSFVHFASGAVVAVPTAGASSKRLPKKVILVVGRADLRNQLVPVSARKVKIVHVITHDELATALNDYGKQFKNWIKKQEVTTN